MMKTIVGGCGFHSSPPLQLTEGGSWSACITQWKQCLHEKLTSRVSGDLPYLQVKRRASRCCSCKHGLREGEGWRSVSSQPPFFGSLKQHGPHLGSGASICIEAAGGSSLGPGDRSVAVICVAHQGSVAIACIECFCVFYGRI